MISMVEGTAANPGWVVFEGPVFDDMTELHLDFELLEMDWYPRFGVREDVTGGLLNPHDRLVRFNGSVPLEDGLIRFENSNAVVELQVRVRDLY